MHYLLTGGAGFIGSWLSRELLERGHSVTVLDDGSVGDPSRLPRRHPELALALGTAADAERVDALVAGCDLVVHLAAAVGVERIVRDPEQSRKLNASTTRCTLDAAIRHRRPIVFASSSEVYGATVPPFREAVIQPPTPGRTGRFSYARSKWRGECLVRAAAKRDGLETMILRFFNTVGPGQTGRYGMVLPRFTECALRGEPLIVHGDGQQTRCFADVRDVASMVADLTENAAAWGQTINVGADRPITIRALAERVLGVANSTSPIRLVPYATAMTPGFDPIWHRSPDLARLRGLIGRRLPTRPLEETIRDVLVGLGAQALESLAS